MVLKGISEMTENFEQQRFLVQAMVQRKFEGILEKGIQDDEIITRTKEFVKTELEKKVDEIVIKHDTLKSELEIHKENTSKEIEGLKDKTSDQAKIISTKDKENKKLKDTLQNKHINEKLNSWKRPAYWLLPLIFGSISLSV